MRGTAGYSGTPLLKKLGIKPGFRIRFIDAPAGFAATLGRLPAGVVVTGGTAGRLDCAVVFADREAGLRTRLTAVARRLVSDGMLWAAWPKKSSGVPTDLRFDVVQSLGIGIGLVDTKICAIDDVWSGLRFVIRVKDRPARRARPG
ncbi:MAG: DUF3052 domain-containing protein [Acidobacteria bacterium]|nr:DUF3052 domain-containing protein [Acidobacteriota bacterium]